MKSGTMYEQKDIVIVPFPFTDLSSSKQRPVLVLSRNDYNEKSEDIITCGITSNLSNKNHSLLIDNASLSDGFIPVKSRIKVDKLFTINKSLVRKKVAKLNNGQFELVKKELFSLIE